MKRLVAVFAALLFMSAVIPKGQERTAIVFPLYGLRDTPKAYDSLAASLEGLSLKLDKLP